MIGEERSIRPRAFHLALAVAGLFPSSAAADVLQGGVDAWSLAAQEDGGTCLAALKAAGYRFQASAERSKPDATGCGMPHGVVLHRGPTGITYDPPIAVDCSMARALGSVEQVVQEEAAVHLHSKVVKVGDLGGFACRPRNFRKGASLSAHAFGSAVDIASFHTANGQSAVVLRDYPERRKATRAEEQRRQFLHAVYARLRRGDADLTYVVGPDFNRIHANHFHLDRGGWHFWFNR